MEARVRDEGGCRHRSITCQNHQPRSLSWLARLGKVVLAHTRTQEHRGIAHVMRDTQACKKSPTL